MQLTNSAINAILEVMQHRKLDPRLVLFEFQLLENGGIGIGFTRERYGQIKEFDRLSVVVDDGIQANILVDFGEVNDRKGLFFKDIV